jgi:hypothetical protein
MLKCTDALSDAVEDEDMGDIFSVYVNLRDQLEDLRDSLRVEAARLAKEDEG